MSEPTGQQETAPVRPPRRPRPLTIAVALVGLALAGGLFAARPAPEPPRNWNASQLALIASLSPLPALEPDPSNRYADVPGAAALGHALFFDTRLSANGTMACASCHKPSLYFTDGQPRAVGLHPMRRNTPTIIGSQWSPFLHWDGNKDSLWSQALGPLEGELEIGSTRLAVVHVVSEYYAADYEGVFGALPPLADGERFPAEGRPVPGDPAHPYAAAWNTMAPGDQELVNRVFANVGKVLAAYERKLLPRTAPFDRYVTALLDGQQNGGGHLGAAARRGLEQFVGPAGCINCHNGPLFTDHGFHNVGLPLADHEHEPDPGRARGAWTVLTDTFGTGGQFSDSHCTPDVVFLNPAFEDSEGAFKTPTLRNVARTAPYGHGGSLASLEQVVEFYKTLPRVPIVGHRDLILKPLSGQVDTGDMVAFLRSLTGPLPDEQWLSAP